MDIAMEWIDETSKYSWRKCLTRPDISGGEDLSSIKEQLVAFEGQIEPGMPGA
ncbi:hypothetical protein OXB_1084 [Bacillus sp. OxB-1]|nr:hypothetical protein OXB_1084 [Bacillus sp. OxB-1]